MLISIVSFMECEQGQDMVEYALMLAFVCLVGAAMFIGMGNSTSAIWTNVNNGMAYANSIS